MKNILIPTDFSENSWNSIIYALHFFKRVHCTFHILHVSKSRESTHASGFGTSIPKTTQDSESSMKQLMKRIEKQPLNVKHTFETGVDHIFFIDAIRRHVLEKKIDYIVMGTKGATGLKEMTVGSNTGDVITKVKCPVLVIPENAKAERPGEIAFPTDFHMHYKKKVLDTLLDIIHIGGSSLRVLHVSRGETELSEIQQRNKEFLHEYMTSDIDHSFHFLTNDNLEDAIQNFVESRDIKLIAMIAKNLNFFQRVLFQPTIKTISYHTSVPFLVLHE